MGIFKSKEVTRTDEDLERELVSEYTSCFSGPAGEYVLRDLYQVCGVDQSVFVRGEFDPYEAAFQDGMRYVALRLLGYAGKKPFNL